MWHRIILTALFALTNLAAFSQIGVDWAKVLQNKKPKGNDIVVEDLATDQLHNTYIVGAISGTTDFDPGPGTVYAVPSIWGYGTSFFAKYDSIGNLVFVKTISGAGFIGITSIAVDAAQNIFLAGGASFIVDFDPGPGIVPLQGSGSAGFVAKYDPMGNFLFHKEFGSTQYVHFRDIALDPSGNIIAAGEFVGTADLNPDAPILNFSSVGYISAAMVKLNSAGNFVFAKTLVVQSPSDAIDFRVLAVDNSGYIHLGGLWSGTADFDPGPGVDDQIGTNNVFFTRYDPSGNYVYVKTIPNSPTFTEILGMATDANGNLGICGAFRGTTDFDPGAGVANLTSGFPNGYFAKYGPAGNYIYAKSLWLGSSSSDAADIGFDASGNAMITGSFNGDVDFDLGPGTASFGTVVNESYLAKYDPNGNYIFAKRLGGTPDINKSKNIAVASDGKPHIAGIYVGPMDADPSPAQNNLPYISPPYHGFFGRYDQNGNHLSAKAILSQPDTIWDEAGKGVAQDHAGNIFVTGFFKDTVDFDPGPGTYYIASAGATDAFLAKYDSLGALVFAFPLGNFDADSGHGLAVDLAGNVFVTGSFRTTVDFDPGPGTTARTSFLATEDLFLAKYGPTGNLLWVGTTGEYFADQGRAVGVDSLGNVYLTGSFNQTVDFNFGAGTANLASSGGSDDIFVAKYTNSGSFIFAKSMVGTGEDKGLGIAVAKDGTFYLTGTFEGTCDFDPSGATADRTSADLKDVFVAKYTAAGNFIHAGNFEGLANEIATGISFDAAGNTYASGYFTGTVDFNPGAGTFNITSAGGVDAYLVKLSTSGGLLYANRIGGTMDDYAHALAVNSAGDAYLAGSFQGTCDFGPAGGTANLTTYGTSDAYVSKYDPSGNHISTVNMGLYGDTRVNAIHLNKNGRMALAGAMSFQADLDPTEGVLPAGSYNSESTWLGRYSDCGVVGYPSAPTAGSNSPVSAGGTLNLTASTIPGTSYQWSGPLGFNSTLQNPSIPSVTSLHAGTYQVAASRGGCLSSPAATTVVVNANATISGTIRHPNGTSVIRTATVAYSGASTGSMVTGINGQYSLALTPGGNYTVTPSKANDTVTNNGVTTLDLVLMQRHILNIDTLNSPYKIIAGDVNLSGGVTTLDIVLTRTVVLQTSLTFPNGRLWNMVPADHAFPLSYSPWGFPSTRTYASAATTPTQDYYGIKLGDVNWSWSPSTAKTTPVDNLVVNVGDASGKPGDIVTVPLSVRKFNGIAGYQFTLEWDPAVLEYAGYAPVGTAAHLGDAHMQEGKLLVSWNEEAGGALSLEDGSLAFNLRFRVLGESGTAISIGSGALAAEAYRDDLGLLGIVSVAGKFSPAARGGEAGAGDELVLLENFPNPFSGETTIRFALSEARQVKFVISDLQGRVLRAMSGGYDAGAHELVWNGRDDQGNDLASGTYVLKMVAGEQVRSIRMVLVRE